jgi:hypothetical protein
LEGVSQLAVTTDYVVADNYANVNTFTDLVSAQDYYDNVGNNKILAY